MVQAQMEFTKAVTLIRDMVTMNAETMKEHIIHCQARDIAAIADITRLMQHRERIDRYVAPLIGAAVAGGILLIGHFLHITG